MKTKWLSVTCAFLAQLSFIALACAAQGAVNYDQPLISVERTQFPGVIQQYTTPGIYGDHLITSGDVAENWIDISDPANMKLLMLCGIPLDAASRTGTAFIRALPSSRAAARSACCRQISADMSGSKAIFSTSKRATRTSRFGMSLI